MIKGILEKLIRQKLGMFIKNLTSQQLKTDLFGGEVTLTNVELNQTFFNQKLQDTFLHLNYSSIGRIFIQAPLTKLSTVPVTLLVDDVYVLLQTKNFQQLANKQTKLLQNQRQTLLISYIKKLFEKMMQNLKDKQDQGYLSKIMNRVIDNLTIKISKVHVRIQHISNNITKSYSTGLTIQEVSLRTADENWKVNFIDRYEEAQKTEEKIKDNSLEKVRKLVNVTAFNWYWESFNDNARMVTQKNDAKSKYELMKSICIEGRNNNDGLKVDLISLTSQSKILINPKKDLKNPLIQVSLNLQPIIINLQQECLFQIIQFSNNLSKTYISANPESNQQQKQTLMTEVANGQHKKNLEKLTQQIVSTVDPEKQIQNFEQIIIKKLNTSKQITFLVENYQLDSLLKQAQSIVKAQVIKIKEKKLKKQTKGWFSKERQLTEKQKQELQELVENTFLQTSLKRPKGAPFLKTNLFIEKLQIRVLNKQNQNIIFAMNQMSFSLTLSKDMKSIYLNSTLTSVQLYYLSSHNVKTILVKNFGMKENTKLIELEIRIFDKQKIRSTKIRAEIAKILVNYEHFLIKKITDFVGSVSKGNTEDLNKIIGQKSNKSSSNSPNKQPIAQFEYLFEVNVQLSSPTILLPVEQTQYIDSGNNSLIQLRTKQCWVLDLGCLSVKNQKNTSTHLVKLKDISLKHCKTFNLEGDAVQEKQCTYSFISGLNVEGQVHISDKKELDLKLGFQQVQLSVCYTEYKKILKIVQMLMQFIVEKNNSEMDQIILNAIWQGPIKKKEYKIHSGYVYVDYFAILTNEKLYLYQKQGDLKYKQHLHLKQYQLKTKQNKGKQKALSQISEKSSEISQNSGFYSKIQLQMQKKQYVFKISNQAFHEFEQKILPLLAKKQNIQRLQEIVQEVEESSPLANNEDQDVFEEFDDIEGQSQAIETSIRKNLPNQDEIGIEIGSSATFSMIKLRFEVQKITLRYDQDHNDERCSIKGENKNQCLYELSISQINAHIINDPNRKHTNFQFSIQKFQFTDYLYLYRTKMLQSVFILQEFALDATYIQSTEEGSNIMASTEILEEIYNEKLRENEKEQFLLDVRFGKVVLNWKPDVFLAIIHFFNHTKQEVTRGSFILPEINNRIASKKIINEIKIDNFISENPEFWQVKTLYDQQSQQNVYQKENIFKQTTNFRMSIDSKIHQIEINFIHRESHIRVFKVTGNQIYAKVGMSKDTLSSQVFVRDLKIIDTTSYPQNEYIEAQQHLNPQFILFGKKQVSKEQSSFIQVKFIKHENELNVCNSRRINSAISVQIEPSYFFYFQQPILRIIDYSLVQVLTLLTDYNLIEANESLNAQLSKLRNTSSEKQKQNLRKQAVFVVFKEYEELLKKLLHPLFSDISVLMKKPQIILKATKNDNFSMILQCETVSVKNAQRQSSKRVNLQNIPRESIKNLKIYEETYHVNLTNIILYLKQNSSDSKSQYQFSNVIQGSFDFDKLLFDNELEKLYPSAKLVRDLNFSLKFTPELNIPELSRATYQSLLKIANFNFSFDDGQDEKFIHNYQISKLRDPNLINFTFQVPKISLSCCYDDPNEETKTVQLMTLNIHKFDLGFYRDKNLDSQVKVNFQSLQIDYSENQKPNPNKNPSKLSEKNQIVSELKRKSFLSYPIDKQEVRPQRKRDIVYLQMSKSNNSKAIIVFFKNLTLFVDMKIINAAQQFFNVQKWVYPVQNDTNSPLSFHCELQNAQIYVPQQSSNGLEQGFLIKGIVYFQYKILEALTFESVQKMFKQKLLNEKNLNDIGEFTNMSVKMWVNFFYYRKEEDQAREDELERRILELTEISFSNSLTYGYLSNPKKNSGQMQQNSSQGTVMIVSDMKINTSELRVKVSFSDYLLLEKIMNSFSMQKQQAQQAVKYFNKINDKNSAFYQVNKGLDQIQSQKPQISPFSQLSMEFGGVVILVYDLKFNPIIQVKMSDFNLFKKSSSVTAQMGFEGKYFNDDIFVWQPFLQENTIIFIYQESSQFIKDEDDERSDKYFEFNLEKQVRLNFSRELMKNLLNLKYAYNRFSTNNKLKDGNSPGSMSKIQSQITPGFENSKQIEFISHYVIRNETGYPLKIYSSQGKEVTIIMNNTLFPYTFDQKSFRSSEIISDTIGVQILYENYGLQTICGVSFLLKKKIIVKLKTAQNKFLADTITIESYCKDSKKILLIASPKYIKDYSWNTLVETYLPFDHPNNVELTVPQKIKVSLFDNDINRNIKSQFLYRANKGCLQIKYPKTVYNYTPIPLEISDAFALPGKFVGIQEPLHIQGIFHEDQNIIKAIHNKQKREYYLYASAYIIDYTGTLEYGFNNPLILKRFRYETIQDKRKISVYLLPDLNSNFSVRWEKQKFIDVDPKLGRQTIQLRKGLEIHQFNIFSYLSNIENSQIKELKKIIEVTESIYLVNQTEYDVMLPQNNYKNEVFYLKKGEKKPFYWQDFACPKQFQVVPQIPQFGTSCMLGLSNSQSFLIPHSSKDYRKGKIFSLVCQNTGNIDFVVIQQCLESRYEVTNTVENSVMSFYLKQNSKQKIFELLFGESLPLAFINNQMRSEFFVQIILDAHSPGQGYISEKISIEKLENTLFEKQIVLRPNTARSAPLKWLCLQLTFENKKKRLKLGASKPKTDKNQKERKQMEVFFKIPKLYVSLIGNFQFVRKEIFVFILEQIGLNIIQTKKAITYSVLLESLRIENLYKNSPYYEVIAYSQLTTSKCFMKFVYSQSLDSPNLIYYLGFSMGHLVLTATSQELQIFLNNMNDLMRDKYILQTQEHEFVHITYDQKINPQHLAKPDDFIYFVGAEIRPFKATVTFKNVSGWGGMIGKAFGNINQCKLQIDGKAIKNMLFPNFQTFLTGIQNHFIDSIKGQLFSIVGSLTLISTPLNVASKIKTGFENFFTLPAQSFENNPLDLGKGVALGTGSLLKNTFQGIFEGAQSLTSLIGNGISMAITDDQFNRKRAEIKNKKSSNVAQGLGHGVFSIFNGISEGITGVITEPVKGASKKGFGGFGLGLLKGVTGLVTKPITGIVDGVSKTAEGIKNTTKIFQSEQKSMKIKKTYLSRPFYGQQRSIKTYDRILADWNSLLIDDNGEEIHTSFVYVNIYKAKSRFQNLVILITPTYTFVINSEKRSILQMIKNEQIRKIQIDKKENQTVSIGFVLEQHIKNLEFRMMNGQQATNIVKDIETFAKPLQSAISYRNDD